MRCQHCNAVIEDSAVTCPVCGGSLQPDVEVLSPEERDEFHGLTIDTGRTGGEEQGRSGYYEYRDPEKGVFVRQYNLFGKGGLFGRIVVGLIIGGILCLMFPVLFFLLVFVVILGAGGFLSALMRRR